MKLMRSLKIGKRLILSFGIVIVIMLAIGLTGYFSVNQIADSADAMYAKNLKSVMALGKMQYTFMSFRLMSYKIDQNGKPLPEQGAELQKLSDESFPAMEQSLTVFKNAVRTEQDQKNYDDLWALLQKYKASYAGTISAHMADDKEASNSAIAVSSGNAGELNAKLMEIVDYEDKQAYGSDEQNASTSKTTTILMIALPVIGILVSIVISILITGSITRPVKELVTGMDKLAAGDTGAEIQTAGRDEIATLAKASGKVAASIHRLTEDALLLSEAGSEGRLSTRADASRHQGEYRKIVEGVNQTLDAVIEPLSMAAGQLELMANGELTEAIDENKFMGDFQVIISNLNRVQSSLYLLLEDSGMLVHAAAEGRLATRADASRHKGGYRQIIQGINDTLDAVIQPVNEASTVLSQMAQGNLSVNVTGNYKGDHAVIKNAMNDTINTVKGYIGEISAVLAQVAGGNMDVTIDGDYRGDFVEIKYAINNIADSLSQVLGDISAATEQVATGSGQVSAGSQALSQGATEQASAIEELTTSLADIAAQTRQNAMNASQASELAVTARDNAVKGNGQMKEMQQAMTEINESSSSISRIIKVIDEIAFQTNLLALNAAVEAARAGQHGKGFAVVAEEVRNLAQRSANAAKETTAMIEESIKKVKAGTRMADETAAALNRIVNDVEKATNLVGSIAEASNEQASAIAQVNKGIEQVSQVVQTNSATAEESAATSEELSSQATLVKEMVGRFSLRGQSLPGNRRAVMTPAAAGKLQAERSAGKPRISLNDREFGKY